VTPGSVLRLDLGASTDPDGDQLRHSWWQYREPGTFKGEVTIRDAGAGVSQVQIPQDAAPGQTIHLIGQIIDSGKPPLTRYTRVIATCVPRRGPRPRVERPGQFSITQTREASMRTFLLVLVVSTVTFAQPAPNFSGKWQFEGSAGRGGRGGPQTLILNQVGNEVTGEFSGGRGNAGSTAPVNNELWDGKVSGTSISFYVWRGSDRPAKTFYKGELNAAGDQITFTITGGPAGRGAGARGGGNTGAGAQSSGASQEVVAKRAR
jgi:hypothetical protein